MITRETPKWTMLHHRRGAVTEVPIWSRAERALYFVDVYAPALRRLDPTTGIVRDYPLPERIGSFGLRPGGGAVLALASGIFDLDLATGELVRRLATPFGDDRHFNDGRSDPRGRFVVGTSQDAAIMPLGRGSFYRIDAAGPVAIVDGITTANGIAFSPDGTTMYTAETRESVIYRYDYDLDVGAASNRQVFARLDHGEFS